MEYFDKREGGETLAAVQAANRRWWTDHTMSYDWNSRVAVEKFSQQWFDEIDQRFILGARLFAHDQSPFDRIIPFERLKGRKVLEIGCGMGLHTELMTRAGADVTAVDISDTSVTATRKRLELKGLTATVRQMDAVELEFPDNSFDFVWSWGVIHHSSHTGRIIKQIHRVLKPDGETRIMVYNLEGMPAYITMAMNYLVGFWRGRSLDYYLWQASDGFTARFYSKDILVDTFNIFFRSTTVESLGQEADAVPLPRMLRNWLVRLIPEDRLRKMANKRGAFLQVTAVK